MTDSYATTHADPETMTAQMSALLDVQAALAQAAEPSTLLHAYGAAVCQIMGAVAVVIAMQDAQAGAPVRRYASGLDEDALAQLGDVPVQQTARFLQQCCATSTRAAAAVISAPVEQRGTLYVVGGAAWSTTHQHMAAQFAAQIASAYTRADQQAALQQRVQDLEQRAIDRSLPDDDLESITHEQTAEQTHQLLQAIATFSHAITTDQVKQAMIDYVTTVYGDHCSVIKLLRDDGVTVEAIHVHGYPKALSDKYTTVSVHEQLPTNDVIRHGESLWIESRADFLARYPHLAVDQPWVTTQSQVVLPLKDRDVTLGSWSIAFIEMRVFNADERAFLLVLSHIFTQALRQAMLLAAEQQARAEAEQSHRRFVLLATASQAFNESVSDLATLLAKTAQRASEALGGGSVVYLLEESSVQEVFAAYHPDPAARAAMHAYAQERIAANDPQIRRRAYHPTSTFIPIITDAYLATQASEGVRIFAQRFALGSMIVVPITLQDHFIGLVGLGRMRNEAPYSQDDLQLAEALTERAGLALHNAVLYQRAQAAARQAEAARELFHSSIHMAPTGFMLFDTNLRCRLVNSFIAELTQLPLEDHPGHTINEYGLAIAPTIDTLLQAVRETGQPQVNVEIDGGIAERSWLCSCYAVRAADQTTLGIVVKLHDITHRKRDEHYQALQLAVTRILTQTETRHTIVLQLMQTICQSGNWDVGELWSSTPLTDHLHLESEWFAPVFDHRRFPAATAMAAPMQGGGLLGSTWTTEKATWHAMIDPANAAPRLLIGLQAGIQSGFAFPIRTDSAMFGVMAFFSTTARPVDHTILSMMTSFGVHVGQFFKRKQVEESLWQHTQRLKTLHAMDQAILALQSPTTIAQVTLHHMRELIPFRSASVLSFDVQTGMSTPWAIEPLATASSTQVWHVELSAWGDASVQSGHMLIENDLRLVQSPLAIQRRLLRAGFRSYVVAPIASQSHFIGSLTLLSERPSAFPRDVATIVQEVTALLAIALYNAQLLEQVQQGRERMQALSIRLVQAQEEERRHVARELHDEIGQSLTAAHLNLQMLMVHGAAAGFLERVEDSVVLVEHILQQVRTMSLDLRPSMLDDLGLVPALKWLLRRQSERAGLHAQIVADAEHKRYASSIETVCFRVVQEALNNIVRYAQATNVVVTLEEQDHSLHLAIQDNGIGFDVERARTRASRGQSMGLISMQERVELAGGRFSIESTPEHGTHIHVWLLLDIVAPKQRIERRSFPR